MKSVARRIAGAARTALALVFVLNAAGSIGQTPQAPQHHVHQMAPGVMPFDLSKTVHIFKMTEAGGVERVVTRQPNAGDEVVLIQRHLKNEAARFQQGDYSDPAALHGASMPGLKDLQAGASRITVSYAPLPDGGQITFENGDLRMVTAIHRWFGAQLSEHGADAKAE